jgi:hypothetical protein
MDRFEEMIKYFAKLYDIFQNHDATNNQKLRTSEQLIGDGGIMAIAVIEFPNKEAIHSALKIIAAHPPFVNLGECTDKIDHLNL